MSLILKRGLVFGGVPSAEPYFTFAATQYCNYKCSYCCVGAENHGFQGEQMALSEMLEVAEIAYDEGIRIFRITGGEPTTWRPLEELIAGIHKVGEDTHVNLNSNGALPDKLLPIVARNAERLTVRISVDRVTAGSETPKVWSPELQCTLKKLKELVPVRVNMVVMRSNLHEVPALLDKCNALLSDVKLLDLYYNRDFFGLNEKHNTSVDNYWQTQFVPLCDTLEPILFNAGFVKTDRFDHGGFGIPLPVYYNDQIYVSIKDSTLGTHFHPKCAKCPEYRCQEGLYSPMLSNTGVLHVSECRFSEYMFPLLGKSPSEKRRAVRALFRIFRERYFSDDGVSEILTSHLDGLPTSHRYVPVLYPLTLPGE